MEAKPDVNGGMDLTSDVLEQQGRNLRALARSLLRDAHAADDVVQESWLVYFAQPAGVPGRLSAWLGTVTRRLAARRVRGDGRRLAREEFAAAPESVEALHELALEREEALRVVTAALLALDEPFKSTLILRYYDERSPTEIAKLQGLPLATVKSRLARGLERLREKLGPAFGGDARRRTRALGLLAGVPLRELVDGGVTLTAGATPAAIASTSATSKVLGALAAACLLGVVLWLARDEPHAPLVRSGDSHAPLGTRGSGPADLVADSAPIAARGTSVDGAPERRAVATVDESRADPLALVPDEKQFPYRVSGVVRDERDDPLAGARVYFAPRGFVVNSVAQTDAEGRFAFEFDGRRTTFEAVLAVSANETYLDLCEVRLVSGREFTIDVVVDARVNENGAVSGETWPLAYAPECLRLADGRVCFVDPPPTLTCARPTDALQFDDMNFVRVSEAYETSYSFSIVQRDWSATGGVLSLDGASLHLLFPDGSGNFGAPPPSVSGVARQPDGSPAADVRIAWRTPDGSSGEATTGADGAFALVDVPPGEVALLAGGGDDGLARAHFQLGERAAVQWHPLLDRGAEVSGRVVDAHSHAPLANARVELWSAATDSQRCESLWCDSAWTDADGRFVIPNVPAGALELHVRGTSSSENDSGVASGASVFPSNVVRSVFGRSDVGDIEVVTRREVLGSIALTVVDANGAPASEAQVIVWHTSSGRGVFMGATDEPGGFAISALPSGSYRVEVVGPSGRLDLGVVTLAPEAAPIFDFGDVHLAPIGSALIVVEPSGAGADEFDVAMSLWSSHPDVFGHVATRDGGWNRIVQPVHAGAYLVWTSDSSGAAQLVPLDVPQGAAAGLTLEQSPTGTLTPLAGAIDRILGANLSDSACAACHAPRRN
jgi:RNA polymerase sigma factor (sigma-70 family)